MFYQTNNFIIQFHYRVKNWITHISWTHNIELIKFSRFPRFSQINIKRNWCPIVQLIAPSNRHIREGILLTLSSHNVIHSKQISRLSYFSVSLTFPPTNKVKKQLFITKYITTWLFIFNALIHNVLRSGTIRIYIFNSSCNRSFSINFPRLRGGGVQPHSPPVHVTAHNY